MFRRNAIISKNREKPTVDFFLHIEHASTGNIGYLDEILGEHRQSSGSNSSTNAGLQEILEKSYNDAFDYAISLGVHPNIVARGRMKFYYSTARKSCLSGDQIGFKKKINIKNVDYKFATMKHLLLFRLSFSPTLVLKLIKLGEFLDSYIIRLYLFRQIRKWLSPN